MRVFVAGASGAIGRRLVPQLVSHGHQVTASIHTPAKAELLRALGAEPVVMDGLDAAGVGEAVARAQPDAIIHQMTALSGAPDFKHFDRWFATTNELRTHGTEYLLAAANATGVVRFIAQSYTGWPIIREGGPVKTEEDPFDPHPPKTQEQSLAAIRFLEKVVLGAPLEGIVLRYGNLYGPGASDAMVDIMMKHKMPLVGSGAGIWSWTHIDDAAGAAVAALEHGKRGIYNIVDDDPAPVSEWLPYLAEVLGAKKPMHVPAWLAKLLIGEAGVSMMTKVRGSSNARAKRELDWQPLWHSWRDGFHYGLTGEARAASIHEVSRVA